MTIFRCKNGEEPSKLVTQQILFQGLPLEIRELIYHHLVFPDQLQGTPRTVNFTITKQPHTLDWQFPYFLPTLCRVNECMRIEVGLWFLRNIKFSILYPQHTVYFRQFLRTFPQKLAFEAISRLEFPLFGKHRLRLVTGVREKNHFIELMKDCPYLTEVQIKFEAWSLLQQCYELEDEKSGLIGNRRIDDMLENPDLVLGNYGLEEFFDLESLKKLTLEVWPKLVAPTYWGYTCKILNCWPAMEDVVDWFKNGFEESGRRVDVVLVESRTRGLRWAGGQPAGGV